MKKYIVLTVVLFLAFFLTGCSEKDKRSDDYKAILERGYLIVGVKTDSVPFGFYNEEGSLKGVDIEIAKAIADNIFRTETPDNVMYVPVTASDKISKLNSKEVDILVATMSINEKRKLIMDFSTPYFAASQKLMVKKDSKITNLMYFNSKGKLGVIIGTTGEKILRLVAPNAYVIGVKTYTEAKQLLQNGQIDAILADDCLLAGLNDGNYKIINRAYSKEYYGVAIRKSPEKSELLSIINATIAQLVDTKELNVIKRKYIKQQNYYNYIEDKKPEDEENEDKDNKNSENKKLEELIDSLSL